ncbi:uncharacterized protein LOC132039075 [Lycium ferocissimum]|uniref:uncharacterized protein LOC132039075 n=1 Tax=Lycium ferocissimum TaxID=112874 RepID=UPI002816043E|nr:uncharacterized protein LOC132039075 [Lycium ferocissimum]
MVNDVFGVQSRFEPKQNFEQPPNEEAMGFYQELEEAIHPLWVGSQHSKLFVAVRMINIKSDWTIAEVAMDSTIKLMGELASPEFDIPTSYYQENRLVSELGVSYDRIHCCPNGCMLFYKQDADLNECKLYGHACYRQTPSGKMVPIKAMHYLPVIPRLKRLLASPSSASHMRWHNENRRTPGVMCHPSDREAWKHFDRTYPNLASEPRNIHLGLCADGFTPYSVSAAPYSCWPIFLTPYNLLPEMCMTSPYIFLNCVILGPRTPKVLIDVYLQPLIDELKQLWCECVVTYDVSTKSNFNMHASLMWTINDFPAYEMLSGWMTAGKLACSYCMENSKAFTLKHGHKNSWFDCHRQFLPMDHEFRKMKQAFRKNKTENDPPSRALSGEEIWGRARQKHNPKARLDFKEYCRCPELNLQELVNNKVFKPKASFSFTLEEKREICRLVKNLRMRRVYHTGEHTQFVEDIALGPGSEVKTMKMYIVNVTRLQLMYPGYPKKKITLFRCKWFDPSQRGTRVNRQQNIIDVKHTRQYNRCDPFIIAQNAKQVYYAPYPLRRDKADWWVVIKTKPVGRIEVDNALDVAYQNDVPFVHQTMDTELENSLEHPQNILEEVDEDDVTIIENVEEESTDGPETSNGEESSDENETSEDEWEND